MTKLNAYINFKDKTKEAMEFYESVLGGELTMTTFKEGGMVQDGPDADLIMHSMLIVGPEMTLMASDIPSHMEYKPAAGMGLSLSGENEDEARLTEYWSKLLVGGTPFMPLGKAPWGDTFGMLTDKFGISWMVNIAGKKE